MTPKEKAQDLVNKFYNDVASQNGNEFIHIPEVLCKQCALIAVDEIIKFEPYQRKFRLFDKPRFYDQTQYWKEVKQEIKAL